VKGDYREAKVLSIAIVIMLALIMIPVPHHELKGDFDPLLSHDNFSIAQSLDDWDYRQAHTINAGTGAGTNYQIRIILHFGPGSDRPEHIYLSSHSRTDFGDVRFTDDDGITQLDYWRQSYSPATFAIFWVEVQDDLDSSQTIYIYYGNAAASTTSSGVDTFPSFDDFERNNSETIGNGWIEDEGSGVGDLRIFSGSVRVNQYEGYYCHIERTVPSLDNFVMECRIQNSEHGPESWNTALYAYWASYEWQNIGRRSSGSWDAEFREESNIGGTVSGTSIDWRGGPWYQFRIRVNSSNIYPEYSIDGIRWTTVASKSRPSSWNGAPSLAIVGRGFSENEGSYPNTDLDNNFAIAGRAETSYIDDFFIRKYASTEPSHSSWNNEEFLGTTGPTFGTTPPDTLSFILIGGGAIAAVVVVLGVITARGKTRKDKPAVNEEPSRTYISELSEMSKEPKTPHSSLVSRLINLSRVVMYFSVAFVQYINLDCLQQGSTTPCDAMLVYVPLFLGLLDSVMVIWSDVMTKRFWQVAFLVSVLAVLVSLNTLIPIFQMTDPHTSLQSAMLVFGSGIILVSVLEMIFFIGVYLRKQYSMDASQPESSIRTY
jgi:hypothetical protein